MKKHGHSFDRLENIPIVQAIRSGLVMAIPVLMIGSFALILQSLPIPLYQLFLEQFLSGLLTRILSIIYNATFGLLSIYMTLSISISYVRVKQKADETSVGAPFTALICYAILSGVLSEDFSISTFGVKGMFTAILASVLATQFYLWISEKSKHSLRLYTDGADAEFNHAVAVILPALAVVSCFALANSMIMLLFGVSGFQALFINSANLLFQNMGRSLLSGLLFVLLSSFLWFFGIHGSDVLEGVSEHLFVPAIEINQAALAAGTVPHEIFSKTFFDTFVLMGGCGAALCLLLAIYLFSKRHSSRNLAKMATIPMLFNINELMVFGFPIVFNPVLFLPFLITPLVAFLLSFCAMSLGLVPVPIHSVTWTTPIFFSGYLATGSLAGSLLQALNLAVGILIYRPFVKLYESIQTRNSIRRLEALVDTVKESEQTHIPIRLTELKDARGATARLLVEDLRYSIGQKSFALYYQPQYHADGHCIGAEALLRWKHPIFGLLYPPLVIQLAEEAGLLLQLEEAIVSQVAFQLPQLKQALGQQAKICVNVSGATIQNEAFAEFLYLLPEQEQIEPGDIWLEVTEQMALHLDQQSDLLLRRIRTMGYHMAIDDFSMGHTSLQYLQSNQFDLVKLDGSLVRNMEKNPRSKEIISSIVYLSQSLGFSVLAEYVETEEQRKLLESIGCLQYQGYLYSPARPLSQLLEEAKQP